MHTMIEWWYIPLAYAAIGLMMMVLSEMCYAVVNRRTCCCDAVGMTFLFMIGWPGLLIKQCCPLD